MIKQLKRFINLLPETWERAAYSCWDFHPLTSGSTRYDIRYPRVAINVQGDAVDVLCPFNATNEEYGMIEHFRVDAVMDGDWERAQAIGDWMRRNPWYPNDQNTYYCPTCSGGTHPSLHI